MQIALADPLGAALYSYYTHGELKAEGSSITEGIGQGRITANLEGFTPDVAYQIPDEEALPIVFDLLQEEGLCLGGSTGINIAGAIRLARELGPGHTIVTILCDYGTRYQSKLFNPEFLRSKNLPVPGWMEREPEIAVPLREGGVMASQTEALFRDDAYLREAEADVVAHQRARRHHPRPHDLLCHLGRAAGRYRPPRRADGSTDRDCRPPSPARPRRRSSTFPRPGAALPEAARRFRLAIDWERRYRLMRMHTACHLLTVVCPFPITGAAVGRGRLPRRFRHSGCRLHQGGRDGALMELVAADHPVFTRWITDEELAANPGLVKSKNVRPPAGTGRIRLVCIGDECGRSTASLAAARM